MRSGCATTRKCDGLDVAALWPSCATTWGVPIPEIARDEGEGPEQNAEETNERGIW